MAQILKIEMQIALRAITVAAMGMMLAPIGMAQQTSGTDKPAVVGLEEIVVTARKREESIQRVPVDLVAFTAEQIERYQLSTLENIAGSSPDLFVARTSNGSGAQITMRGIGSQATSVGIQQSTAVVVDGVYYGSGYVINEALFDLKSMEILKGPQALFFGKNATAGVISATTASPTEKFEALARVGYEFESRDKQAQGIISGALTSTLRGRLAVSVSDMSDGYFKNTAAPASVSFLDIASLPNFPNLTFTPRLQQPDKGGMPGTQGQTVRGTLVWLPTDRFTATFKASWSSRKDDSNAWNYVPTACGNGTGFTQVNPGVPCARNFDVSVPNAPEGLGGNLPDMKSDGSPYNDYRSYSVTADLGYQMDAAKITSVTNYNWSRNLWGLGQNVISPTSYIAATQNSRQHAISNETRYQTNFTGPFNFMIGAYYQKTDLNHQQAGAFAPLEDSSLPLDRRFVSYIKLGTTKGQTTSGFGQATWRVTPKAELSAGVRYIRETSKGFLNQSYVQSALKGLFLENTPVTVDQTFESWTPEATITWYPSDKFTLYAGYKSAYKSGGFSASALIVAATKPGDIAFRPETADGFEIGMKSTWLENQLRLNVSAYTTDYKNLQVDFFNSITFQFITTNAGKAKIRGLEVTSEYAPHAAPGLRLNAGVNYNRARYADYIAPCYGGQSIAAGCNTTFQGGFGQDLSGAPLAVAPKFTGSLGGSYTVPVGSKLDFEFASNLRYSSDYLASSFNAPLSRQPSYTNLDATLTLRADDKHWEVALIARNVTNSFHVSSQLDLPNSGAGTGTSTAVPADQIGIVDLPRRVTLQYTHRF